MVTGRLHGLTLTQFHTLCHSAYARSERKANDRICLDIHGELMARLIGKMDKLFQRFVDTCC